MLRERLGSLVPALVVASLLVATAGAQAATATAKPAAKPATRRASTATRAHATRGTGTAAADSVLARLPFATITVTDYLRAWAGLDPQYRPAGTTMAAKRAFLDQMIQKDLLAHAAVAEPFQMAPLESAQFRAEYQDLLRRAVFRRIVSDSATVTTADIDTVRARLDPGMAHGLSAAQLANAARPFAERRRAGEVDARIRAQIAPVWDDSVAALLVRAYTALDPKLPDASHPLSLKLPMRQPVLAPADSGRVLATTSLGPLSAAEFTYRFLHFDPFKTPLPTSIDDVHTLGQQILGQIWFDIACQDPAVRTDPEVLAAVEQRRESIALDHYYARHVTGAVDTTEALLRARYTRTPDAYATPAHWSVTRMPFPNQGAADSAQAALAHGTPWDSLCAHAFLVGDARMSDCSNEIPLPDPYPDTIFTAVLAGLKTGEAAVLPMPATAPDDERRLLVRLVGHTDRKFRSYEDARGYVMRDVQQEQSERILDAEIARLRAAAHVTTNERALARVDLAGFARMVGRAGTSPPSGSPPPGPPEER